jgi:hypothetical protein
MFSLFRFLEVPVYQYYGNFKETFESRRENGLKDGAITLQVLLRGLMMRRKKDDKLNGRPLIVLPPKVRTYLPTGANNRRFVNSISN